MRVQAAAARGSLLPGALSANLRAMKHHLFACAFVIALSSLIACSDDSSSEPTGTPYDSIYTVAPSASPNTTELTGVWKNSVTQQGVAQEQRLRITGDTLTISNRCSTEEQGTVTVGVSVGITVGEGMLTINDPGGTDSKTVNATATKPAFTCAAQLKGPGQLPYSLGNDQLQLGGQQWDKLAD